VFSTNTFWIDARALDGLEHRFTYVPVTKRVDGRTAVQFERILNELTLALSSRLLLVPREGDASRFVPVKDLDALAASRRVIAAVVDRALRAASVSTSLQGEIGATGRTGPGR
jgi:UTP--glucose-1-phosphate uridylyltransferase